MTPKGVAAVVVITMIIVLIAIARDFLKKLNYEKILLRILIVPFPSKEVTELFSRKVSDLFD